MWDENTRRRLNAEMIEASLKLKYQLMLRDVEELNKSVTEDAIRHHLQLIDEAKYPTFKIELLEGGRMPTKVNPTDAGWDCYANLTRSNDPSCGSTLCISEGWVSIINLGFKLEIPEGWEAQIRGRSGMAGKKGFIAHFGTIDHLYRGEVSAILLAARAIENKYKDPKIYGLEHGDKVCQMVFSPVYPNKLVQVDKVEHTERGGFGSTGK